MATEPAKDLRQAAGLYERAHVAELTLECEAQLRRVHGAERVAREVAKRAVRPVDVLHAAVLVVALRGQAEPLLHLRVPQLGDVRDLDAPFHQVPLQLVAQDDVGRVGDLVRIDADKAGLDPVVQLLEVRGCERILCPEVCANARRNQREERGVMAELHLAEQALALVNAHGTRLGHRLAEQCARQALLVTRVTRLVDDAHQAGDELLLVVARGDAHVRRHAAAERVAAHVEPAVSKIKAEQSHHLLAERLLRRNRERALRGEEGVALLPLAHGLDEAGQPARQIAEDLIQPRARHAGLVQRQHGVIGAHPERVGAQASHLPRQAHHLLEVRGKTCPVVLLALATPGVLAFAAGERQRLHQRPRQQACILPLALDLPQVRTLVLVQRFALCLGYPLPKLGGGALAVDQHAELRHCFGAGLVAPLRHHGGLIPAADGGEVGEAVQLLLMLFEFLV